MSIFKPKRILYRIILPFTLLFGVTTISSWLFSAYFITRYLDQSLKSQMSQVAGVISKSSYVLDPVILRQLKEVINSEIVLFDREGRVLRSTFPEPAEEGRLKSLIEGFSNAPLEGKDMDFKGASYRTIIHPLILPKQGQAFLSLWMPTHEADYLKVKIILGMGGVALFGILAMAGIGYLIARTITAPVEELVGVTGKVAGGDLTGRVGINSSDEIGSLAASFNHMIDQLTAFEQRLVESEKLATAGQMAAGLAHEIRNPLTSIKMMAQVLHKRLNEQPRNQDILRSLVTEIDRLDRIIEEMINRTRPGELRLQLSDLTVQVEEVISIAEEGLRRQHITLEQNFSECLPRIPLDREKMKQVLWNLILNGKEAMPKGGRLIISTDIVNGQSIALSVEDSGPGIRAEVADRLFQPFFTTKPEGVGLGLTMSRKIMERHGGRLTLENRPEGGAKATVLLPIKEGPAK